MAFSWVNKRPIRDEPPTRGILSEVSSTIVVLTSLASENPCLSADVSCTAPVRYSTSLAPAGRTRRWTALGPAAAVDLVTFLQIMLLRKFTVGEPLDPAVGRWPEGAHYQYDAGGHLVTLLMAHPSSAEVSSVRRGPAEFALFVEQPAIFLLCRFLPALLWHDAPYSIHLVAQAERVVPQLPEPFEERVLIAILLVDADSGIIKAARAVSLSPDFTAELHLAVREQVALPWNRHEYEATIRRVYARYPTAPSLAAAATMRCAGGL